MTPDHGRCSQCCPERHKCSLSADVPHKLHVCSDPKCKCHSKQRYEEEAKKPEPEAAHEPG